jgi:hypothetical protein
MARDRFFTLKKGSRILSVTPTPAIWRIRGCGRRARANGS